MKSIVFSHGLMPIKEAGDFIERYFSEKGFKVFAVPSHFLSVDTALDGDDELRQYFEDCHDQLVMYLIEKDFPTQVPMKEPEIRPEEVFAPKNKLTLYQPSDDDLKKDWSKFGSGIDEVLKAKSEGKKRHYKMK